MGWAWKVEAQLDPASTTAWIDITRFVQALSLTRGREDDLEQPEASTLTLQLKNTDGRFSPENSLGAYHPRITVNRGVRASVDVNGIVTRRFTGHTIAWDPIWAVGKAGIVTLVCSDAFERLARFHIDDYAAAAVIRSLKPDGYWQLGQADDLTDLSPGGITAATVGTVAKAADWIPWAVRYIEEPYWGPTLAVGDQTDFADTSGVAGAAYVPDSSRYGVANGTFSLHFRVYSGGNNPDRNIIGIGQAYQHASASTNRFIDARWALYTDTANVLRLARGNGDGTQTTWSLGITLYQDLGYSFVLVVTPTRVRVWQNGQLKIDDLTDTTPRIDPSGNVWMGSFGTDSSNDQYDMRGYGGRISDVAIWSRDISADVQFADLLASHHGWYEDPVDTRIGRVLNVVGWPTADRSISVGHTFIGPLSEGGNAAGILRELGHTDAGIVHIDRDGKVVFEGRQNRWLNRRSIVATYGDGTGESKYRDVQFAYDTVGLHNRVTVRYKPTRVTQPTAATDEDAESIAAFGVRDLSFGIQSVRFPRNRANLEVQTRKDMRLRISKLGVGVINSDSRASAALAVQLGDLIRVIRRPAGESAINQRVRVLQIVDDVYEGGKFWSVSLAVANAEVDASIEPYDVATYGASRFAY